VRPTASLIPALRLRYMKPSTSSQIWLELLQWSPLPMTLTEKLQSIGPGETPEGELHGGIGIGRNEAGAQDGVAAQPGLSPRRRTRTF
jgi:hypothetical protein